MSTFRSRHLTLGALLATTAMAMPIGATQALAQGASSDDNEIIVTAQRRSQRLEDVPMTVTAISPETLASSGVNTVRDLQNVTTGFQVGNSGSYPQPAIRGITTTNAGSYENNVAVFMDGLYQAAPHVLNMDLPNVQSIQILKGPQGTLYGRNATGGAILIDTLAPGDSLEGNVELTLGRFMDRRARAYVSGPLSDRIGFSIAGTYRQNDGYFKEASRSTPGAFNGRTLGLKQYSVRAKLRAELTDTFSATIGYSHIRASDPRGILFTPIENVDLPYTPNTGNDTRPRNLGEVAGDIFELDFKMHETSLTLELETGIGKLRSANGYTTSSLLTSFDFGGSYVPDNYSTSLIREKVWQSNLDFSISAIENFDLILGGNYYNIKTQFDPNGPNSVYLGPANLGQTINPAVTYVPTSSYLRFTDTHFFRTKEAWAVFADATFRVTDQLSISAGARYTEETQNVSGYKLGYSLATGLVNSCNYSRSGETYNGIQCGATVNGVFVPRSSAKRSHYGKFTPRAAIRYEITPETSIYASFSRGFRGGEWNSVIPGDNPANWLDAKPETADSYEIGIKHAGPRLRFELAGYHAIYKDLQVSFTQNVGGVAQVVLQNAPRATIWGVDATVDFKATENLTLRAGATWLKARYGDGFFFTGSGVNPGLTVCASCGPDPLMRFDNVTASQDLSGLQMARAPEFTGFFGVDYNVPNGDGGIKISANVKYTSSYVVTNPSVWGGDSTYNTRLTDNDPTNNGPPVNTQLFTAAGAAGQPYLARASEQRARQGAYALFNASITWTEPSGHFYIRLWANNITNVKYRTHYNPLSNGTYAPIGEPATFGGTFGLRFGR